MADGYSDIARDHFEHPRNAGAMKCPDAMGTVENPVSGASIVLYLRLADGAIAQVMFQAQGCAATIAAGSITTELLAGKTPEDARALTRVHIETALGGLPPTRKHAADLAIDAVRAALSDLAH